jgi:hypothetical protein
MVLTVGSTKHTTMLTDCDVFSLRGSPTCDCQYYWEQYSSSACDTWTLPGSGMEKTVGIERLYLQLVLVSLIKWYLECLN